MTDEKKVLSLNEFLSIKNTILEKLASFEDLRDEIEDEEEANKLVYDFVEKEYLPVLQSLKNYDLSTIPASAWEGFIFLGLSKPEPYAPAFCFDLSGTGANIDFSIIETDKFFTFYNFKGCHISHLEELTYVDSECFDDDVIESNFDVFLDSSYPEEFRDAYLHSKLTIELYGNLPKELRDKLSKDIVINRFENYFVKNYIRDFSFERFEEVIDYYENFNDLFALLETVFDTVRFSYEKDYVTELKECPIEEYGSLIGKIVGENFANSWGPVSIEKIPKKFIEDNPQYFLAYPEVPDEVRERYYNRKLTLTDAIEYYPYLKDVLNENIFDYKVRDVFGLGTEEEVSELFTKHMAFLRHLDTFGGTISRYDILSYGDGPIEVRLFHKNPSLYLSYIHENNVDDYSGLSFAEVLKKRDARTDKENELLDNIIESFGLDNILRFQEESNYFMNNHHGNGLHNLEVLYLLYLRYDDVKFDKDDYDSFCAAISEIIEKSVIDREPVEMFRNEIQSTNFREKYSFLFIDEELLKDLPELERKELIDKFYSKELMFSDVKKYPVLKEALKKKRFACIFKYGPNIAGGSDNFLEMCSIYGDYLISVLYSDIDYRNDIPTIMKGINDRLYEIFKIGDKYRDDLPDSFKTEHPRMFLPKDAPAELKEKFYKRELSLEDFNKHPDWYSFFKNTDIICGFITDLSSLIDKNDENLSFDENNKRKLKIISAYQEVKDETDEFRQAYIDFVRDNYEKLDDRVLHYLKDILYRLYYSNSSKLSRISSSLVKEIAYSDDPMKNLALIEQLYLQNHLPEVAKTYAVFRILHSKKDGGLNLNISRNSSPVLIRYQKRPFASESIVFSDLVKASIESNNKSVRQYIYDIKEGDRLYREYLANGLKDLSEEEKKEALGKITYYSRMLIALYNESRAGKKDRYTSSGDVFADIGECIKRMAPGEKEDYDVPDRLTRMFAYFAGFESYDELISHMDKVVANADEKNRERVKKPFVLHRGDLIKGLNSTEYLRPTLRNGAVATEFLGDAASDRGDCTPLDTDLSYIDSDEISLDKGIEDSISRAYGPIWLVLESDDPDIFISRDKNDHEIDSKFDKKKIEAFRTNGSKHFGIRTGFGSTHISYIVIENGKYNERLGLEVVMNGFYIPIVNRDGELLFTPDDYDRLRTSMQGLSYYGMNDYELSSELITPEIEVLSEEMKADAPKIKATATRLRELFANEFIDIKYAGDDTFTLTIKDGIDGDLTVGTVEVIDTGSTGRGTNSPNDSDFDYMFRLDANIMKDNAKMSAIRERLSKLLGEGANVKGEFRVKQVELDGIESPVDIDISFLPKRDKLDYTTDMCLKDRLSTIKKQHPKEYPYVVANIVYAKNVMKEAGCYYKHGHSKCVNGQGGLGGVGIENWILQNGGSFITAARGFLKAAYNEDKTGFVSFDEFKRKYKVWDFGENFEAEPGYEHDEFVYGNMDAAGYNVMCSVLAKELEKYDARRQMFEEEQEVEQEHYTGTKNNV